MEDIESIASVAYSTGVICKPSFLVLRNSRETESFLRFTRRNSVTAKESGFDTSVSESTR
jgi:hypothetical protein